MDPVTIGMLGSAAVGGISSAIGNASAAETNAQAIREANSMNIGWAKDMREFNERLANTAHQRQVADMKAAGLNPILSGMKGGGAAVPNSQSPNIQAAPDTSNAEIAKGIGSMVQQGINTAIQAKQVENIDAETKVKKAQAVATIMNATKTGVDTELGEMEKPILAAKGKSAPHVAEAEIAEAATRKTQAEINRDWAKVDAWTSRILQMLGGASDAMSMKRFFGTSSGSTNNSTPKTKEPSKYEKIQQELLKRKTINQEKKDYGLKN